MAKVKRVFSVCADELNKKTSIRTSLFAELSKEAAYRDGDITIWKIAPYFYRLCYKNIIIGEITECCIELVNALTKNAEYDYPYQVDICRERIGRAEEYAKEYGFKLESI